ncbi:MAG TPA: hypothetical protein VFV34_08450, partial [Blastocatellia bacterium]|nr:hypothetical protein [Blastocatellia bacterium]
LDPGSPSPAGHVNSDTLRRMLEVMIDQRLVAQEAARLPSSDITQDEIDKEKNELIKHFKSENEFRQRIEAVGLTAEKLDEIIRGRIQIEHFVDFRFRAFVFVSEQDIQKYYDEQDVPAFRNMGRVPPPLKDRREWILTKLREDRVSEEIDRWLPTARQKAEIVTVAEP